MSEENVTSVPIVEGQSAIQSAKAWKEFQYKIDRESPQYMVFKDLCTKSNIIESFKIGNIKLKNVMEALKYPAHNWRILLRASDYLMKISPHYYRLNTYYSNMALCLWGIDLYGLKDTIEERTIKSIKKSYARLAERLEDMNLKHEFTEIMKVLPYQDVYYGVVVENDSDFFIQPIRWDICELYQVQDKVYNFKINLSAIKAQEIGAYPDYIQREYLDFIESRRLGRDGKVMGIGCEWYIPPADKQICIKLNSQWTYPYPMLISIIRDILDLDIYKNLKLQSARTDNYKAISMEVPISKDKVDVPLITPNTLSVFADINRGSVTDDIGLIYTLGSTGQPISFKNSSNTRNNVSDAVDEIYNSSGESRELYNGSSSGTAVTLSVENDAGFIYGVYRQFERWVNRYIKAKKYNKAAYKFKFWMLDATVFNRDKVSARYKDSVGLGATVVDKWLASVDRTPSTTFGSYVLHKDIFDYSSNFVSLSSAYNSSASTGNKGAGRPTNESEGELLSDSGEQTKDSDANADR